MTDYLIIGNGAAGTTAAETIRKQDPDGSVTLITSEALPYYSRIRLPDFVAGRIEDDALVLKGQEWHDKNHIRLVTDTRISSIDYAGKKAVSETGDVYSWDRLLLATGSRSFIPPVDGSDVANVFSLRTADDAGKLRNLSDSVRTVVLIGGGLLGLEAGASLLKPGRKLIVVEFFDRLLPRQLDYAGAERLQKKMEAMGFSFRLGQVTEAILGDGKVEAVRLKSGEVMDADAVLFSAGVRSNLDLVGDSGMETDRGIVVNERMETSVADVFAAGDVAQFNGVNFCIWPEAVEQGRVAGITMTGGSAAYTIQAPSNRLKVAGIDLAAAGEIDPENKFENEVTADDESYKKIVRDESGAVIGCIMLGDTSDFNAITKQIKGDR